MVVNSKSFWFFFIIVLLLYYGLSRKSAKWQNAALLAASYVFYGIVDWKMCFLLLASTVFYYVSGAAIAGNNETNPVRARRWKVLGVLFGVGVLLYFKYLDFFVEEIGAVLSAMGLQTNLHSFGILVPVGISFYMFKLMSYVLDIHRGVLEPCRDPVAFGAYVAFFPTLMAGPIDRPGAFLPQLNEARSYSYVNLIGGLKLILWGLFMKLCIADQLAGYTDAIFGNYENHSLGSIFLASGFYYFQLYSDFAGYSIMAVGVGRMMGLRVTENFNHPILAGNISEYWQRWHISLTSWITQYVFMPLNLSFRRFGLFGICLAAVINAVVIGAWHGANWTYIIFGLYHGVLISVVILYDKRRKKMEKKYGLQKRGWYNVTRILITFVLVDFGMVLFQSPSVADFIGYLSESNGTGVFTNFLMFSSVIPSIVLVIFKEWKDEKHIPVSFLHSENKWISSASAALIIIYILLMGRIIRGSYIYFQF